MNIMIHSGLNDTNKEMSEDSLPDIGYIPQVGNIIYFKHNRYVVYEVIIDYDYEEIGIWVKDAIK